MKTTAITRQLDKMGRVVLPVELRKNLKINPGDFLEIYVDGDRIILCKDTDSCVFCGSNENVLEFRGKCICSGCMEQLKK